MLTSKQIWSALSYLDKADLLSEISEDKDLVQSQKEQLRGVSLWFYSKHLESLPDVSAVVTTEIKDSNALTLIKEYHQKVGCTLSEAKDMVKHCLKSNDISPTKIGQTFIPKVNGKTFRCLDCGSNCQTKTGPNKSTCNGCGSKYVSE